MKTTKGLEDLKRSGGESQNGEGTGPHGMTDQVTSLLEKIVSARKTLDLLYEGQKAYLEKGGRLVAPSCEMINTLTAFGGQVRKLLASCAATLNEGIAEVKGVSSTGQNLPLAQFECGLEMTKFIAVRGNQLAFLGKVACDFSDAYLKLRNSVMEAEMKYQCDLTQQEIESAEANIEKSRKMRGKKQTLKSEVTIKQVEDQIRENLASLSFFENLKKEGDRRVALNQWIKSEFYDSSDDGKRTDSMLAGRNEIKGVFDFFDKNRQMAKNIHGEKMVNDLINNDMTFEKWKRIVAGVKPFGEVPSILGENDADLLNGIGIMKLEHQLGSNTEKLETALKDENEYLKTGIVKRQRTDEQAKNRERNVKKAEEKAKEKAEEEEARRKTEERLKAEEEMKKEEEQEKMKEDPKEEKKSENEKSKQSKKPTNMPRKKWERQQRNKKKKEDRAKQKEQKQLENMKMESEKDNESGSNSYLDKFAWMGQEPKGTWFTKPGGEMLTNPFSNEDASNTPLQKMLREREKNAKKQAKQANLGVDSIPTTPFNAIDKTNKTEASSRTIKK